MSTDVARRILPFYPAYMYIRGQSCNSGSKVQAVHSEQTGKTSSSEENRRNLAKERVVRFTSPGHIAGITYLCWAKGSVALVLASESASSLPGSSE